MLKDTFQILESWGVRFHLCLSLVKPSGIAPCMGYVFATEFCLLGFYGSPMQKFIGIGKLNWLQTFNKAGQHSAKPDEFYRLVEQMSPEPRLDIFARKRRYGWDCYGDEVPNETQVLLSQNRIIRDKRENSEFSPNPKSKILDFVYP